MTETIAPHQLRATLLKVLGPVRAGVGAARFGFPDTVIPGFAPIALPPLGRLAIRLLGVRQLGQATMTTRHPTRTVLWLGAAVDVTHAASMLGLATFDRRYRRPALVDAALAFSFALIGAAAASSPRTRPPNGRRMTK